MGRMASGSFAAAAREMNLSETAFLVPQGDGYNLRWFTPAIEVDLCGHATVATAHVLWQDGHIPEGQQARLADEPIDAEGARCRGDAGRAGLPRLADVHRAAWYREVLLRNRKR